LIVLVSVNVDGVTISILVVSIGDEYIDERVVVEADLIVVSVSMDD
jgi:hypothetical protein